MTKEYLTHANVRVRKGKEAGHDLQTGFYIKRASLENEYVWEP